jgi:hypothetical protein
MFAGFAERDITPEPGIERPGGYGKSFGREVHDPCKVRAAVLGDGSARVALVGIDALVIPAAVVRAARREIEATCGIPPKCVLVGASHTHSGGPTGMVQPGEFDDASDLVKKLAYKLSSCANADYLKRVQTEIINAVVDAKAAEVEAKALVGSGHEDKACFNRRFRMKNGLSYTHPGKGNPDILEYAGPIDPEVGVVGAFDLAGGFLGCVVNFACHGTTSPGSISADWIYYLEKTIRGAMGEDAVVVFLQGACGDITQVDNLEPYANPTGEQWAKIVGHRVGAEAVKVLATAWQGELGPFGGSRRVLQIERRRPWAERVVLDLEVAQKDPAQCDPTEWTFAKETVMLDAILRREPVAEVEVQAIQVGPAVFLSNPAEYFCELGLDLKRRSAFPFTFPVELANGFCGYVPTEEAMGPHGGGYETRLTSYSNLAVSAGQQIAEACVELANERKPGAVPGRPPAPPFTAPWSYGDVPPEPGK